MSRKRIISIGIFLLLLLGAGGFFVYQRQQASASTATTRQTATLERGSLEATVSGAGNLYAPQQTSLNFGVADMPVTQVKVKVGDQVKAGDVLAAVNDTQLQQSLATAEANLASAQAQYDEVTAPATADELAAAEASVRAAQGTYDAAVASLSELQAPPDALDLRAATAKLASAQETYKSALAESQMTNQKIIVARASLETARISLESAQSAYNTVAWRDDAPSSSQAAELQTATINYASAQAQYELTMAEMNNSAAKTAEATLASAQSDYNTLKQGATTQELATAQAAVDSAMKNLTTANQDLATIQQGATTQELAAAQATLQSAKASYESAKLNLDDAKIIAPFDGTVAEVNLVVGQTPSSSDALLLSNLDNLEIKLTLSEVDIAQVKAGQKVQLTMDALEGSAFTGQVLSVSPVGTTTSGVVNYTVIVGLDPTKDAVLPGMTAAAEIVIDQRADALLAPNRAIKTQNNRRVMTLLFEGGEIPVFVQTGLSNEGYTEILAATLSDGAAVDLQAGDTVVLNSTTSTTNTSRTFGGATFIGGGPPP